MIRHREPMAFAKPVADELTVGAPQIPAHHLRVTTRMDSR